MAKAPFRFNINLERTFNAVGALEELGEKLFKDAQRRAGERSAALIKAKMEEFLLDGRSEWPENHPLTQSLKGFNWPLMETGQMAQSITFITLERGSRIDYLVGFPAGPAADKALRAEFGKTILVTDKMRRFMAWKGFPLKADTKAIFIPPRQIFQPAFDDTRADIQDAADDELEKTYSQNNLDGLGGGSKFAWLRNQLRNDALR